VVVVVVSPCVVAAELGLRGPAAGGGTRLRSATVASRVLIRLSAACFSSVTRFRSLMRRSCDDSRLAVFALVDVDGDVGVDVDVTVLLVDASVVVVVSGAVVVVTRWSVIRVTTELIGVESSVLTLRVPTGSTPGGRGGTSTGITVGGCGCVDCLGLGVNAALLICNNVS